MPEALAELIPVAEDYGEPSVDMQPPELEGKIGRLFRLPDPWVFSRGYVIDFTVSVADTADDAQRIVATGTAVAAYQFFADGDRQVQIETVETSDPIVRLWADYIIESGTTSFLPLGNGFVRGPTAVLDTGTELVRATFSDGEPANDPHTAEHIAQRVTEVEAGARRVVESLLE